MKKHQLILLILFLFLSFSGLVYSQEPEQGQGNYFLGVFAFEKGDYEARENGSVAHWCYGMAIGRSGLG